MQFLLAFKVFFAVLFNRDTAKKVERVITAGPTTSMVSEAKPAGPIPQSSETSTSPRSDALTLISTLQREARFLDLVQEPLDGYSDAQIGAAARDVLRDTSKVLNRLFGIEKLVSADEGQKIDLPKEISTARWRISGSAAPGSKATLVHAGWVAKHAQIPQWSGSAKDSLVIAPAEVES